MLPKVLPRPISKVIRGRDVVPVNLHKVEFFNLAHWCLGLQNMAEKQDVLLSRPLSGNSGSFPADWNVFWKRRSFEGKLDKPCEVDEGNLVWDILATEFNSIFCFYSI